MTDATDSEWFHAQLVTHLRMCTSTLFGELDDFDEDLVLKFCVVTLFEHSNWLMNDAMHKVKDHFLTIHPF